MQPDHSLEWLGGESLEFVTPSSEQRGYTCDRDGSVPGYSVTQPFNINRLGLGNIYIQPQGQNADSTAPFVQQAEYLVVIEVSSLAPVNVTRISDREVSFADWQVTFNPDGSYVVTNLSLANMVFTNGFE